MSIVPLDLILLSAAWVLALLARPWRLLERGGPLRPLTPFLGCVVLLPWVWIVPRIHALPVPAQLSGACLVALMLGWPLAVLTLTVVAGTSLLLVAGPWPEVLAQLVWQGIVPATIALGAGVAVRRWIGEGPFLYVLGRSFFGTAVAVFVGNAIHALIEPGADHAGAIPAHVVYWLMAWGEATLTGMIVVVFVAFRPQWLATWSDRLYLRG